MVDDTSALEYDAENTRGRIAATIDNLHDRLSPAVVFHRTIDSITSSTSEAVDAIKKNFGTHPAMFAAGGVAISLAVVISGRSTAARAPKKSDNDEDHTSPLIPLEEPEHIAPANQGNTLLGPILSALAGVVLAQIVPVSAIENKMHRTSRKSVPDSPAAASPAAGNNSKTIV